MNIGCLLVGVGLLSVAAPCCRAAASYEEFDRRAKEGDRLTVVFFGASLTWGANATDQMTTSYRARMAEKFEALYPKARFRFYDGAIGGTGSQLGVFRLERDALSRKPDLVFLDFSANDDIYSDNPESLASYESLVRRLVAGAGIPVVEVIFPFKWNVTGGSTAGMKRRDAHLAIAKAYNVGCGDAITLAIDRIKEGKTTADLIWDTDGVHPGDDGYRLFADAAWAGYLDGVTNLKTCKAPETMLYADTYMKWARVRLSSLFPAGELPAGWAPGKPHLVSGCYDMLMSRWLDDLTIASSRKPAPAGKKTPGEPQEAAPLRVKFNGAMVLLFGESTTKPGPYRVMIDGKAVTHLENKVPVELFDAGQLGKRMGGNAHHCPVIASGLDPAVDHVLEIVPVFAAGEDQEIRLESVCVAGGKATVERLPAEPAVPVAPAAK